MVCDSWILISSDSTYDGNVDYIYSYTYQMLRARILGILKSFMEIRNEWPIFSRLEFVKPVDSLARSWECWWVGLQNERAAWWLAQMRRRRKIISKMTFVF